MGSVAVELRSGAVGEKLQYRGQFEELERSYGAVQDTKIGLAETRRRKSKKQRKTTCFRRISAQHTK